MRININPSTKIFQYSMPSSSSALTFFKHLRTSLKHDPKLTLTVNTVFIFSACFLAHYFASQVYSKTEKPLYDYLTFGAIIVTTHAAFAFAAGTLQAKITSAAFAVLWIAGRILDDKRAI